MQEKEQKTRYWKNREEMLMKNQNEDMKIQIEYLKKKLNNDKKIYLGD